MCLPLIHNPKASVQRIIAGENRAKSLDNPLGEAMECVAVETAGVFGPASPPNPLFEVIARIHFESDCQNPLRITTGPRGQQEVSPLGKQLRLAGAWAGCQRHAPIGLPNCCLRIRF
ncbi:hypothetical protein D3C85_1409930 [compost metagenome]